MIRKYRNEDVATGRFDPMTMVESSKYSPNQGLCPITVREHAFIPTEFGLALRPGGHDCTQYVGRGLLGTGRESVSA